MRFGASFQSFEKASTHPHGFLRTRQSGDCHVFAGRPPVADAVPAMWALRKFPRPQYDEAFPPVSFLCAAL